jgi:predicted transcriptional regulator of viral defense system
MKTQRQFLIDLAKTKPVIGQSDLKRNGIHPETLRRLLAEGIFNKISHGQYILTEHDVSEHFSFAVVMNQYPESVVCLLSALSYHEIGTQIPEKIWIAVKRGSRKPSPTNIKVNVSMFSGQAFTAGQEHTSIDGVEVSIYNPAKTVADCFKYRNKIGLDVAIEALTDCRRQQKCTNDELWYYAKVCRVANVMRPYMEALG